MEIIGFLKNSFVDFPGKISCVVFTPGCNMNCWYCHNRAIINQTKGTISPDEVFHFLKTRQGLIDGVVITGGEPTLQPDLFAFMQAVKELGFLVKLDTNGSNFSQVQAAVEHGVVDYIAMDIKAPFSVYDKVTTIPNLDEIKKTLNYLPTCGVDYEFRTTYAPNLTHGDILEILHTIAGAKRYCLQAYVQPKFIKNINWPVHSNEEYQALKEQSSGLVQNFLIKNLI